MKKIVNIRGVRIGDGIPKICVPITERTQEEILAAAMSMRDEPFDLVEWRADWYNDVTDPQQVRETLRILRDVFGRAPILFTVRTAAEGGEIRLSADTYGEILTNAVSERLADLVDVELFSGDETVREVVDAAHKNGTAVIASSHDFNATPDKDELMRRMIAMRELGADILKLAVMPENRKDVLTLLSVTEEMTRRYPNPVITMAMGRIGMISRICGETFGSAVTFGSAGKASAPGQIDVESLDRILQELHEAAGGAH
jgi:3-dehydroquinate dehydratase-1